MALPRREEDVPQEQKAVPCGACGGPNEHGWQVWGVPMCNGCKNAWDAAAPTDEAWDTRYPKDAERFAAKRKWTADWAKARLAKARAA